MKGNYYSLWGWNQVWGAAYTWKGSENFTNKIVVIPTHKTNAEKLTLEQLTIKLDHLQLTKNNSFMFKTSLARYDPSHVAGKGRDGLAALWISLHIESSPHFFVGH